MGEARCVLILGEPDNEHALHPKTPEFQGRLTIILRLLCLCYEAVLWRD